MLSKKLEKALNDQVNAELYSGHLYQAMAAYFKGEHLNGFAHWMQMQSSEERQHARKIYDYIFVRGGKVVLDGMDKPPSKWKSSRAIFEAALAHEQKVTKMINDLVALAEKENDQAANNFLQWFVDEQVEEEFSVGQVLIKMDQLKNHPGGEFLLDREMGARAAE